MILDGSSLKQQPFRTHLKFENSQRLNITPNALIIRSTTCNSYNLTQLSWGKLRKKPATKWFDKYFAPLPKFNQRFARQHDVGPPPHFHEASPDSGKAHHLTGTNSTNFAEILQKNLNPAGNANGFYTILYPFTFITHYWFGTKILFILQDSLIRVPRRDEERRILKELAPLIDERRVFNWIIKGQ